GCQIGYPDDEDEQYPDREISIEKQSGIYEGIFRRKGVDEEDVKCRCADDRLDQNFDGREPVKLRAPVQKHLHGGNSEAQAAKSEPVKLGCRAGLRLPQKERYAGECEHSQGHVDIEYPSPAVMVGQPAA